MGRLSNKLRNDWILHSLASMAICSSAYIIMLTMFIETVSAFLANFMTIGIGFAKEWFDRKKENHKGEFSDIVADCVGIAVADIAIAMHVLS